MKQSSSSPIDIIETRAMYLSPFSAHQVEIWGLTFPTLEHSYHWARYVESPERDKLLEQTSPWAVWLLSQEFKKRSELLQSGFDKDAVMEELFRAKLDQHPHVKEILIETGSALLVKDVPEDSYWGPGPEGKGQNKLPKLWMRIRDELNSI